MFSSYLIGVSAEATVGRKVFIFDDDCVGFALSISSAGSKRFVLDHYVAGRQRRVTIGAWPHASQDHAALAHLMDSPLRAGVDAVGGMLRPRLRLIEAAD